MVASHTIMLRSRACEASVGAKKSCRHTHLKSHEAEGAAHFGGAQRRVLEHVTVHCTQTQPRDNKPVARMHVI
jgi:hypothetical protein